MVLSLLRLDSLHPPDSFDDSLSAAAIAAVEGTAVDLADVTNGMLSQFKRIIHASSGGNWFDDPETVHGGDASLLALFNRTNPDVKKILGHRLNLNDVTVPAAQNFAALTGSGKPDRNIAISNLLEGAVTAQLAGAIGAHSLVENSGSNNLRPKNFSLVFDGATGAAILSAGRQVYALLQVGNLATDGNAFADAGNDQGQLSFVRANATFSDLEACPVADIENLVIVYSFTERATLGNAPEEFFRGDIDNADPAAGTTQSLDNAYNGGNFITVDSTDLDWRFDDTLGITMRKGVGGAILFQVQRNDAGVDLVQVGSVVDLFDSDAADNDFANGATIDSATQAINIGKAASGVIDSASVETRANTGDNTVSSLLGDVLLKTVRETTALPLDDATAGEISALSGGPHASVSAAILHAIQSGGVDLSLKVFVSGANFNQDVNIAGASLDLSVFDIDANTPANVTAFVFLNGRLLFGGNGTTNNDVYAGDTPANGDLKFDFPKGIKTGDVIITIGLKP